MGSTNRARRAAKQKARDQRRGRAGATTTGVDEDLAAERAFAPPRLSPDLVGQAVADLVGADTLEDATGWYELLADPPPADRDNVRRGLELALCGVIGRLWRHGWLPYDLTEHLRRTLPTLENELAGDVLAVQVGRYAQASLHPRWAESVRRAEVGPERRPREPAPQAWAQRHQVSASGTVDAVLAILRVLHTLRVLPEIVPPPESTPARRAARQAATAAGVDGRVLARVRALLAKAESTAYPEEAEALSAKAQELMQRHALERALVEGEESQEAAVITVRMWLDPPYVAAKTLLVSAVANANRATSVAITGYDVVTVVGHAVDLDAVEILVTSLLVQANRAMLHEGRAAGSGGRSRSRSFRQSFLVAYAGRIRERLGEAASTAADEVDDDRLLPVLARRASAVDEVVEELFGDLAHKSVGVNDAAGWHAGRAAAEAASLTLERDRLDA